MTSFLQVLISGLMIGGVYAVVATGLTLIFGVLKLVNFAHGEFIMIGMYGTLFLLTSTGISILITLPLVAIALFAVGALGYFGLLHWVVRMGHQSQIVLTLALSTGLQALALLILGGNFRSAKLPSWLEGSMQVGGVYITNSRAFAFGTALVATAALVLFLDKTLYGKAIRATAADEFGARLVGINVTRIYWIAFGIGSALAGIAGVVLLPIFPVHPMVGLNLALMGFVVVVLGGLGSVSGALYGGLIVGTIEAFGGYLFGASMAQVIVLAFFWLILLVMPRGIMRAEAA